MGLPALDKTPGIRQKGKHIYTIFQTKPYAKEMGCSLFKPKKNRLKNQQGWQFSKSWGYPPNHPQKNIDHCSKYFSIESYDVGDRPSFK